MSSSVKQWDATSWRESVAAAGANFMSQRIGYRHSMSPLEQVYGPDSHVSDNPDIRWIQQANPTLSHTDTDSCGGWSISGPPMGPRGCCPPGPLGSGRSGFSSGMVSCSSGACGK